MATAKKTVKKAAPKAAAKKPAAPKTAASRSWWRPTDQSAKRIACASPISRGALRSVTSRM